MPNYITNIVTLKGDKDLVARLKTELNTATPRSEESLFNFDAIIPQPEFKDHDTPGTRPDWYVWRLEHWDTKWEAGDVKLEGDTYTFDTAWSTPKKVLDALAQKWPSLRIEVKYADEDIGYNCGKYVYEGGKEVLSWHPPFGTTEADEYACAIKGYDYAEHLAEVNDQEYDAEFHARIKEKATKMEEEAILAGKYFTIIVCGGRNYSNYESVKHVLGPYLITKATLRIVHGGAHGADSLAERWCEENIVWSSVFEANWDRHGKAAGPIRNKQMLDATHPDVVIAFPGGKGTADMVARARNNRVPVLEVPA